MKLLHKIRNYFTQEDEFRQIILDSMERQRKIMDTFADNMKLLFECKTKEEYYSRKHQRELSK